MTRISLSHLPGVVADNVERADGQDFIFLRPITVRYMEQSIGEYWT